MPVDYCDLVHRILATHVQNLIPDMYGGFIEICFSHQLPYGNTLDQISPTLLCFIRKRSHLTLRKIHYTYNVV